MQTSKLFGCFLILLFFSPFITLIFSSKSQAQSFNCRYAKKADEKLICRNKELGRLDERMVNTFNEVMGQASDSLSRMTRIQQDGWLRSRHECNWDERCIRIHYEARIRELDAHFYNNEEERFQTRNLNR